MTSLESRDPEIGRGVPNARATVKYKQTNDVSIFYIPIVFTRGGVAQWIGRRISDQGVPGSIPRRCTFRCGLEQVTFTLCLVLVKPRKRWSDDRLGQTVTRLEITLCLMC